jgi:hypothetical protein
MNLSDVLPHLLYQFKSESELLLSIQEISQKFTTERARISDYLNDPRLVSAYTAFYLLTNFPKLQRVLEWMPREWVSMIRNSSLIDLGAGPGTYSLAWKALGNGGEVYQVETSELMRLQGKRIWDGHYQDKLFQSPQWEWEVEKGLLLFGHSMNEMGLEEAIRYIEKIKPEHILFIEPGTKGFFQQMLQMRSYLLSQGFHLLFPCPSSLKCPMEGTENWCHQFLKVKQGEEVERLSQMVHLDRKLLPLTVGAYSRSFQCRNPKERLVRVLPETKFSFEWEVCHHNHLERYQLMKRGLSRSEEKVIGNLLSGDSISTEVTKTLDHIKRVRLKNVVKL